jgi:hypothetical protein
MRLAKVNHLFWVFAEDVVNQVRDCGFGLAAVMFALGFAAAAGLSFQFGHVGSSVGVELNNVWQGPHKKILLD